MDLNENIDVSVYMLTYFHEKYVSEAIESVLAQNTKYKYELIISDDCSKDRTVEILRDYQQKYPDKIRLQLNTENIGIPRNIFQARCMCRGRYIVALSGDDYWIDENKIEKEVAFLDSHEEYYSLFNLVELRVDSCKEAYEIRPPKRFWNKQYTLHDYEKGNTLASHGFMMRNAFLTEEGKAYFRSAQELSCYVDDAVDLVLILSKGPAYVLGFATDVHRVIRAELEKNNYNSRYSKLEKCSHQISLYNALHDKYGEDIDFSWWYANTYAVGFVGMLYTGDFDGYHKLFSTIPTKFKRGLKRNIYLRLIPNSLSFIFTWAKNKVVASIAGGKKCKL